MGNGLYEWRTGEGIPISNAEYCWSVQQKMSGDWCAYIHAVQSGHPFFGAHDWEARQAQGNTHGQRPEFTSGLFQDWLDKNNIEWVKIQKGKPQQNAIIERFNKTYREDVLDANLFFSLQDVKDLTERWIEDYNYERPHEALDFKTPSEYEAA